MAKRRTIIIATATEADRRVIAAQFSEANEWERIYATTGREALLAARQFQDHLSMFIMDIALMDEDGKEAAYLLQEAISVDCPPVVILLPHGELMQDSIPEDMFVSEVLSTPVDARVARRRLRCLLELHDYQMRDSSFQHLVSRDPLVGLLTGKGIPEAVDQKLALVGVTPGLLAYINMDNTRAINERSGHHFGDIVLVDAAKTVTDVLPDGAVIGRPHGDTFVAFVPNMNDPMEGIRLMEALLDGLRKTYDDAPGGEQHVTACIGVAMYPQDGDTFQALYEAAETAGSVAKKMGRDVLLFYSQSMQLSQSAQRSVDQLIQEDDLPASMVDLYLPLMDASGASVVGYDCMSMPADMSFETYGLALSRILQRSAKALVHQLRVDIKRFFSNIYEMNGEGMTPPRFSYHVILRGDQAEMLLQILQEALDDYPIDPTQVCISIAHDMVLEMEHHHLEMLAGDIRRLGFAFGVFNVGAACIANACFMQGLFDRVLFAVPLLSEILDGRFTVDFLDRVMAYFIKTETEIGFPQPLSEASRVLLAQSLGDRFSYYGDALVGREAFLAHFASHHQRAPAKRAAKDYFSFRIGEDRYNEIFAKSGIIIFDWRPSDDSIALTQSYDILYGHPAVGTRMRDLLDKVVHPEDAPRARDMLLQVKHGWSNVEGIVRVRRMREGKVRYRWRRFFLIAVVQENGIVGRVYGISIDVDRERREMQDIMKRAETDPLTQLLNRGATETKIRQFLEGEGKDGQHALLYMDIDDFKMINDRFGHVTGDRALQYLALQLQKLFRSDDIIGRVGGDEFMVFLKNIPTKEAIVDRAQEVCASAKDAPTDWSMGTTIGIARFPQDGVTFESLYARADAALYQAKGEGKCRWAFFSADRI